MAPATRDPVGDPYPRHAPRPVQRATITSCAMRSTTVTEAHNLRLTEQVSRVSLGSVCLSYNTVCLIITGGKH